MFIIYEYINDPSIYAIFDRTLNLYVISTNAKAADGIVLII